MSVYVDEAKHPFGRMMMCHMLADTLEELHAMADRIGVARKWVQRSRKGVVHYDICKEMRAKAVAAGAIEVDLKKMGELISREKSRSVPPGFRREDEWLSTCDLCVHQSESRTYCNKHGRILAHMDARTCRDHTQRQTMITKGTNDGHANGTDRAGGTDAGTGRGQEVSA